MEQNLVTDIVDLIFKTLEPEIKKAMIQKIVDVSLDKWRFQWSSDQQISELILDAVEKKIESDYKPVLDYIADKKAQEKILKRASQNGISKEEILPLFEAGKMV